ncbi:helix-turn-helix domain-containing protein [Paenibacillus flagellatus]|uniref:AraC family transcriptional regulator n=1 Tax=Paenibacillus flagellatus TaxID=2211139 RepID=A0A2V5KCV5_9BACL|nr:helix-turn-helix domain-containing protein [Paenibacillus flagellatus]PYI57461.1 AraC family transcriptional regulator [Paenibacillus flagellatus]
MKWVIPNRQTLVFKIFFSFLGIILLFSVFNALSVHLFNRGVQNEIIQYNRLMLQNTAERYETHFDRIKTLLFDLYHDENAVAFNRQLLTKPEADVEYWKASDVLKRVRSEAYNPMFYLNNLLLYYDSHSLVVEKEGTVGAEMMFGKFYASAAYPIAYWKERFGGAGHYELHPEATFTVSSLNAASDVRLIPFSFRMPSSNVQAIALLDAKAMQEAFYGTEDSRLFFLLKEDGSLLYRSSDKLGVGDIPAFEQGRSYVLAGDYYYFVERGTGSRLTYVTAVPYANIASRVRNASLTLLVVFAVSVVIGIAASVLFSRQINRPVKQIVTSILRREPVKLQSAIREFDLIHQNIRELMKEKEAIHRELLGKRSLLASFGYINKLKAITSNINEWKDIAEIDEPFFVVLYQLHFKSKPAADSGMRTDRMAYYIHEYVNVLMSEKMPSSHTFQIENNQILTIVRGGGYPDHLDDTLAALKTILDRDKAYVLATIAVGDVHDGSGKFNEAYRQVLEMVRQARPLDESQVVREHRGAPVPFVLAVPQERELYANLQAGNDAFCRTFMDRMIDQMDRKEAGLAQFRQLAEGVIARVAKMLEPYGSADAASLRELHLARLAECFSPDQFKTLYADLFRTAAAIVLARKEERDPVIAFVMDYVENRFADDASLDLLADKLNLSVAYLSVFIKEKTGANFSEHINAVRIRKAKEMLAGTDWSVQDISERIGYRNVTSFIRMFKKMTGVPPGEYRKNRLIGQPEPENGLPMDDV